MKKILIILFFIVNISYSCGLCTVYSPLTLASFKVNSNSTHIKSLEVTLKLTEEFTQQLKQMYDINMDNRFDEQELKKIQEIFEEYAKPKRYFLQIAYDKIVRKKTFNKIVVNDFKTYINGDILHFKYSATLEYPLIKNNFLYIKIDDNENFFLIKLDENNIFFANVNKIERITNNNSVIFSINSVKALKKKEHLITQETKEEVKKETTTLSLFTKRIKSYLLSIKNGDYIALLSLLVVSFIYGVVHAIGPGHGKSLAFSYFVANKSSLIRALIVSQASAFVHIVGALILVSISIFILQSVLNNFVNDTVLILTKISAAMIILLSLYILYQKLKKKSCSCSCCTPSSVQWQSEKPQTNVLKTKKYVPKKQDLYFVITAGLIPCPGTVVLFIYAFILKTYLAVFLASIFISLGMGLVIFASAFLGIGLKTVSARSHKITQIIEILAPLFMLLLGVLLYYNANIF